MTLDGVDLKELNMQRLCEHISLISQEPVFFTSTIAVNTALGSTREESIEATKKAHAFETTSVLDNECEWVIRVSLLSDNNVPQCERKDTGLPGRIADTETARRHHRGASPFDHPERGSNCCNPQRYHTGEGHTSRAHAADQRHLQGTRGKAAKYAAANESVLFISFVHFIFRNTLGRRTRKKDQRNAGLWNQCCR
ncbi:hypothetical protein JM16_007549 [Phytophthora kernoviae]|uniref:Uncharacterized protein n=1 Tax=Phytophthora kernoviae TaxID=325452 RepID=A0A8T0LQI9_9STRA|nr:hypothetical protein JM16_007549 [Phytophthora kernoviae]